MSVNRTASELLLATDLPYGSVMESTAPLQKWFVDRGNRISPVVNNVQVQSTSEKEGGVRMDNLEEPCVTPGLILNETPDKLIEKIVRERIAVKPLAVEELSRFLYSLARHLQKHQGILALVLSADTKRSVLECRKHDIPLAIQLAYRYAGKPSRMSSMSGSVDCIVPSITSPLLDTLKLVLPAVREHRTVVVLAPLLISRTVSVVVEILIECGLPKGAVNFLIGSRHNFQTSVDTLYLCGTREEDQEILAEAAKPDQKVGRIITTPKNGSSAIITDCADLPSAVASLVEAACFCNGQSAFCPSKILIQESIFDNAIKAFKAKLSTLRSGSHWDKSVDYSDFILGTSASQNIELIEAAQTQGAEVFSHIQLDGDFQKNVFAAPGQAKFPLVAAVNVAPTSPLLSGKYEGPLLAFLSFRTIKEAVTLANNVPFTTACSVWSDSGTQAMEIARIVKASTVWINSCHLYDAVFDNPDPSWSQKLVKTNAEAKSTSGSSAKSSQENSPSSVDKTYKFFYGGAQKRPENGMSLSVKAVNSDGSELVVHLPDGGQKDLKNAVDAATAGASIWKKSTAFNRSQILFYLAENLSGRRQAFIELLSSYSKDPSRKQTSEQEMDQAIEKLFFWAGQCGGPQGEVYQPNTSTTIMTLHEALGTVAVVLPQESPFLQFITCTAAALACGNSVVVIPQLNTAAIILEFRQVIESSDVPAGVINIVTGNQDVLAKMLSLHPSVAAVWISDNSDVGENSWTGLQKAAISSQQKLWLFSAGDVDNLSPKSVRQLATRPKNIWIPTTESFAN